MSKPTESNTTPADTGDRAQDRRTSRRWLALAVLCLPVLLVSMDVSILFFAAPDIARDLEPSATQQLWIFDAYGFVLAGLLLTMGAVADRFGRRRILLAGAAAFSLASVLAAWAPSAEMLILARGLMGIGGATLMPSTLALIRNVFHDRAERSTAIGVWSGVFAAGVGIGPVLAGLLLAHFWWGSVFLVNVPVMAVLLLAAPLLLPESRGHGVRLDVLGSGLALATVLPVMAGIKGLAADGWNLPDLGWIVLGLAAGIVFARRQRTSAAPLVDPTLLRMPGVRPALTVNVIGQAALMGNAILLTQYLQSVLGMTALRAALWSIVPSVVVGAVAPLAGMLAGRVGRARIMATGMAVAAAGYFELLLTRADSTVWTCLVGATLIAAGLVCVLTLITELVVGTVPAERAGTASGLLETSSELAGALGMALLGSVVNAAYRSGMHDTASTLPGGAGRLAGGTLAGAVVVAQQVGGAAGEAVLATARTAYVTAMHRADLVAGLVLLVGVVVALTRLPRDRANNGG
ncbi:putative integral membrane efflux protein [Nostocoides japonicum T1-X7]|nr:MFS transporter [Tetrasphaera japonica]CCH77442.1 putative integral membrane efflux protein [Tetrasphaera japonica T1-X7]